jgi:hypothetical protein
MMRFQSHLLSASKCSSMTACGVDCFSGGLAVLAAMRRASSRVSSLAAGFVRRQIAHVLTRSPRLHVRAGRPAFRFRVSLRSGG